MKRVSPKTRRIIWRSLQVFTIVLLSWFTWKQWLKPWLFPPSPLVNTPQVGLNNLQAKSLYYNGEAKGWVSRFRADLLAADDRGFAQAVQEPRLFRQLDRKYRFDTVLLLDDPSNYRRLLDHLIEPEPAKRDFKLVYLDHWMLVFKRGAAREWQPQDADALRAKVGQLRSEDRATFLAKAAERMLAVGQKEAARQWLDEALAADRSSVDALAGMAGYYAVLAKWPETESYADKALDEMTDFPPALQRKFLALVGTKHLIDAYKVSERLLKVVPNSPGLLRQHAHIAHLSKQYGSEIEVLTRLIAMAEKESRSTGEYEFALGEAHTLAAKDDAAHAPKAAEHFRKALRDENLPSEMKKFAVERLQTIAEKTGAK